MGGLPGKAVWEKKKLCLLFAGGPGWLVGFVWSPPSFTLFLLFPGEESIPGGSSKPGWSVTATKGVINSGKMDAIKSGGKLKWTQKFSAS